METKWICRWQLIPGGVEQTKAFPTREAARKAMAKVLTDAIDLGEYINALRKEEGEDCNSSADFLEKFLSDLTIPEEECDVPPHWDIPDHCLLEISPGEGFRWKYMRKECPMLVVSNPCYGDDGNPFIVDFGYENPHTLGNGRINAVWIQIDEQMNYGTGANPFLVWYALREEPQTQDQLSHTIFRIWHMNIERKAIGRHLQLLQDLGYPVQYGPEGYYRDGEVGEPRTDIPYSPSAYPFLILNVLDNTPKTKAAIIQAVQKKYGTKIDRRAVGRNLELLKALGFDLLQHDDGYYLGI